LSIETLAKKAHLQGERRYAMNILSKLHRLIAWLAEPVWPGQSSQS
jgi:hypothetical protein